jgi:hypothetical protein
MRLDRLCFLEVVERGAVAVRSDHEVTGRVRELVEQDECVLAAVDDELGLVFRQSGRAAEDALVSLVRVLDVLEPPRSPELLQSCFTLRRLLARPGPAL